MSQKCVEENLTLHMPHLTSLTNSHNSSYIFLHPYMSIPIILLVRHVRERILAIRRITSCKMIFFWSTFMSLLLTFLMISYISHTLPYIFLTLHMPHLTSLTKCYNPHAKSYFFYKFT